jgi:hypothetical protein
LRNTAYLTTGQCGVSEATRAAIVRQQVSHWVFRSGDRHTVPEWELAAHENSRFVVADGAEDGDTSRGSHSADDEVRPRFLK